MEEGAIAYEALRELGDPHEEPLAFSATSDPDTMYLHQALREPDREEFIKAMVKEVASQSKNGNWRVIKRKHVPSTAKILPAVWAMKRKRRIQTQEVYKWKARLNLDGSKMEHGVDYWDTYAPVASWPTVRLLLALTALKGWHTKQIDFVLAYPQAKAETDHLYMKIPKGFEINGAAAKDDHVLHILKNIYGGKAAGRIWRKHLLSRLEKVGFKKSTVDENVFYRGSVMYVLYVDDSILAGPDANEIDQCIRDLQERTDLELTVEGDISDFLGVNLERKEDGTIHLTQPHLINRILKDLRLDRDDVATKNTPARVGQLLRRAIGAEPFDGHFNVRSVIGKMNYLEKSTRPDIAYAVHQCARFSADPKQDHGKAIKWIGRYLLATKDKGLIFRPNGDSFECYVDADFAGNWDPEGDPGQDRDTARSRTGYVATLAGCPIFWASRLQQIISMSTTEAEYVALSTALREIIPAMNLLKEMKRLGFDVPGCKPKIHCRVFEDNSGALEMASNDKYRPRTKHINCKFHHFRSYVEDGSITVLAISTLRQAADYLTKPLSHDDLVRHRKKVQGW